MDKLINKILPLYNINIFNLLVCLRVCINYWFFISIFNIMFGVRYIKIIGVFNFLAHMEYIKVISVFEFLLNVGYNFCSICIFDLLTSPRYNWCISIFNFLANTECIDFSFLVYIKLFNLFYIFYFLAKAKDNKVSCFFYLWD